MDKKIIYTATLGQASSDFFLVEDFQGKGVYTGDKVKASEEHLELYRQKLKEDRVDLPNSDGYVIILRKIRYGDVDEFNGRFSPRTLLGVMRDHCDRNHFVKVTPNRSEVESLYYVGKDYAGKIYSLRGILNAWDREAIRKGVAMVLENACSPLYRHFNGYDVDYIHRTIRSN